MNSDFRELLKRAGTYRFDPNKLGTIPITGVLRKSQDPNKCVLVVSSDATGDLVVEIALDDVVKHEIATGDEHAEGRVTVQVKPTAILTTSFNGSGINSLI